MKHPRDGGLPVTGLKWWLGPMHRPTHTAEVFMVSFDLLIPKFKLRIIITSLVAPIEIISLEHNNMFYHILKLKILLK